MRAAVGVAVAKLDRLQALQLSGFLELQPVFVDTSEMLARDLNAVAARDFLWKSIDVERSKILGKVLDDHIETAYVGLFSHFPAIRPMFLDTLAQLKASDEEILRAFREAAERDVLAVPQRKADYNSSELERSLRAAPPSIAPTSNGTTKFLEPVHAFLLQVVTKSDSEILTQGIATASGKP